METVTLNELENVLKEDGYTILGHGTGNSDIKIIASIFENGLRASHTSLFYTTIGLDINDNLCKFKEKLDHWEHKNSEYIILIKLPNKYFNIIGDTMDLGCERTGAFVNEKKDETGKITYYLDPKFIIGVYNKTTSKIMLNPKFEYVLKEETIKTLEKKYNDLVCKTKIKHESNNYWPINFDYKEPQTDVSFLKTFDINTTLEDLEWEDETSKKR